ncbi:MAG: hypothetical protein HQL86_03580 [Magnetococcales bacterium]|nr:hypothetical protein [Magnetococcales bacterium]
MAQLVDMTGNETAGNRFYKAGTRIMDKDVSHDLTEQSDRKVVKAATRPAALHPNLSCGAFYNKAHFFGLQKQDLNLLLQVGRVMHLRDGYPLFCEGESNDMIFIILDGQVKLGKTLQKPCWFDMGPYGMVNLSDHEEPEWRDYRVCSANNCLGCVSPTCAACHTLTAVTDGACNVLALEPAMLENQLLLQGRDNQSARIMACLRQMAI